MPALAATLPRRVTTRTETTTVTTTLYELIEALGDVVGPDEDHLVTLAVADLLYSGRVKFLRPVQELVDAVCA